VKESERYDLDMKSMIDWMVKRRTS